MWPIPLTYPEGTVASGELTALGNALAVVPQALWDDAQKGGVEVKLVVSVLAPTDGTITVGLSTADEQGTLTALPGSRVSSSAARRVVVESPRWSRLGSRGATQVRLMGSCQGGTGRVLGAMLLVRPV